MNHYNINLKYVAGDLVLNILIKRFSRSYAITLKYFISTNTFEAQILKSTYPQYTMKKTKFGNGILSSLHIIYICKIPGHQSVM